MRIILEILKKRGLFIAVFVLVGFLTGAAYARQDLLKKNPTPKTAPQVMAVETIAPIVENTISEPPKPSPFITPSPSFIITTPQPSSKPTIQPKPSSSPTKLSPTPKPTPAQVTTFLDLVNSARIASGLGPVKYNVLLNQAALAKAKDMQTQNYFSHTNPQGKTDFAFVTDTGYKYQAIGSNIAEGYSSQKAVFDGWMASSGHKANILASWGKEIGFANAGSYWVMFVANPQ